MKRLKFLVLAIMFAIAFTVTAKGTADVSAQGERGVIEYDTISIYWSNVVREENSLYDQEILKRFGIKFNTEYLSRAAYIEKISLLLATGEGIEVVAGGGPGIAEIKQWAMEGHLVPISDYLDKIPNYRKMFDQSTWDLLYVFAKNADGKLYWLPRKRAVNAVVLDLWRKGTLDRMGIAIPETMDGFHEMGKEIQQHDPDACLFPGGFGGGLSFIWWTAYRFRTYWEWYYDPDSDNIEFGPSTNKMRDVLRFYNKLFAEGLVGKEFPTSQKQDWMEMQAKGRTYFTYGDPARAAWLDNAMESVDPDPGWIWTADILPAYPGAKPGMTVADGMPIHYGGPLITRQCPEEKIPRFLEYLNWAATAEGTLFHEFGVEGKTFEYRDGKPAFMPHIELSGNPDEPGQIATYGFGEGLLGDSKERKIIHWGNDLNFQIWDKLKKEPDKMAYQIAWDITKDQEKEMADFNTVINDVWMEYGTKFIMGILDPSNDSHWDELQAKLIEVGLDKVRAIREDAFKKSTIWRY